MTAEAALADLARRIRHAEAYPFARPACSFLFTDGRMSPLAARFEADRIPVVASGSNAAPDRLAAKFGRTVDPIPVTRALLHDFAVVFAGHFTAYGSIPATLCPCPGAVSHVWITWLTAAQLAIMHRSEGVGGTAEVAQRYDYVELGRIELRVEGIRRLDRAGAYLARRMLAAEGEPIRCADVLAQNGRFRAHNQRSALRLAHRMLAAGERFDTFMGGVLSGAERRQRLFQQLAPHTMIRPSSLAP